MGFFPYTIHVVPYATIVSSFADSNHFNILFADIPPTQLYNLIPDNMVVYENEEPWVMSSSVVWRGMHGEPPGHWTLSTRESSICGPFLVGVPEENLVCEDHKKGKTFTQRQKQF